MAADDAQLTAKARKTITANWLDISQIRIRVTRGVIHLQGHVTKMGAGPAEREGSSDGLRQLDDELHTLPGSRGVAYTLDNWSREGTGGWRYSGRDQAMRRKK